MNLNSISECRAKSCKFRHLNAVVAKLNFQSAQILTVSVDVCKAICHALDQFRKCS